MKKTFDHLASLEKDRSYDPLANYFDTGPNYVK